LSSSVRLRRLPLLQRSKMLGVDVGNVLFLEHVNISIPPADKDAAAEFYCSGLGLTRDPFQRVGLGTMWINVGRQQIHCPLAQRASAVPGKVTILVPDIVQVEKQLEMACGNIAQHFPHLAKCGVVDKAQEQDGSVSLQIFCPWGNEIICRQQWICKVPVNLGICELRIVCPKGAMRAVDWVYGQLLGAIVLEETSSSRSVIVGPYQRLVFEEGELKERDPSFHIAIYVGRFRECWENVSKAEILWNNTRFAEECEKWEKALSSMQFRFKNMIDSSGNVLFELEHEVRSTGHKSYMRTLVNRTGNTGIYCQQ
jgi:hypothetical protein